MSKPKIEITRKPLWDHCHCESEGLWETPEYRTMTQNNTQVGDVRRCVHNRVMVCYEIDSKVLTRMEIHTPLWRTLSPLWTPFKYRAAVSALEEAGQ